MENSLPVGDILEAVDKLPISDQKFLRDILTKRIVEQRRDLLVQEIREARQEYETGHCKPVSVDELIN